MEKNVESVTEKWFSECDSVYKWFSELLFTSTQMNVKIYEFSGDINIGSASYSKTP